MRIIVEGADGVGKTTIVNYLAWLFDLEVIHIGSSDPNTYEWYSGLLEKDNVIFDRHFIGEMIYPYLFNRKGNLNNNKFELLYNKAIDLGYYFLVITADEDTIKQRLLDRGNEPNEVVKTFTYANAAFKAIARRHHIPIFESNDNKIFSDLDDFFYV